MVTTTFKNIIKDRKYKINREIVEYVLTTNNYKFHNNVHKLSAYKHEGNGRYHIEIDLFNDNEVHPESELRMHLDVGHNLFHDVDYSKIKVGTEYSKFLESLLGELKTRKVKEKQRIKRLRHLANVRERELFKKGVMLGD